MKKTESEQTVMPDAELDAALAQMADEVPPMPADFHDRWMNAVRADAQKAVSTEGSAPDRMVILTRWTRILSVAAVFVFLIGGTLLFRSTKRSMSVPYAAEKREAAETAAAAAGGPAAADAAEDAAGAWTEEAEEAAKSAGVENVDKAYTMKTAGAAQNSLAVSVPAGSAEKEADYAAEAAEYDAAPVSEAAEEAPAEMMPTPEPTAAPTPVATAALTEAPVPAEATGSEQTGFLQAAGAFFTDMGDFLLAALPYLAVLAVPAAAAMVVRREKRRRF